MNRLFVLALDGTPYSFLDKVTRSGKMPNLAGLMEKTPLRQMDSVMPPVSSVAWASFMTGKFPHEHGIMGFIDRNPATMEWFVPLADRMKTRNIFEAASAAGKRVFVMNVPLTYPPRPINGISIPGFLCDDITKGTYPREIGTVLKARDYRIDSNTELAKKNLDQFFEELLLILEKRIETMWHFWRQESWDLFMTHIMETDRLHHFFWEYMEKDHPIRAQKFFEFYEKIDTLIGSIIKQIPNDMPLLMLSDHGFTTLKSEFYLNQWLRDSGYLYSTKTVPNTLEDLDPKTKAYSLYPGRIFINLQGREKWGSVRAGIEYEKLRQELIKNLTEIRDPRTGERVIGEVLPGEEIYPASGKAQLLVQSRTAGPEMNASIPDLMAIANPGYDLKGNLWRGQQFEKTVFNGMHTFDDAFVIFRNGNLPDKRLMITDLAGVICSTLNIDKNSLD